MQKNNAAVSLQPYMGPAFLAGGYRPFFLFAALWAVVSLVLWLLYVTGAGGVLGAAGQDMLQWHAHELVYGYGGAVVAGFAFTAIPNWTGRAPLRGFELGLLFATWLLARVASALLLVDLTADAQRAIAEMAFYGLFVLFAAREVVAGKNWRNLKVVGLFALLAMAAFSANLQRLEVVDLGFSGWKAGLGLLLLLICVIGGRIIPAFTGNWMRREGRDDVPINFNKFDMGAILAALITLMLYIFTNGGQLLALAAGATSIVHLARLSRWRGLQTLNSPIVAVLHLSYLWIPVGFMLLSLAELGLIDGIAAVHAWAVGGVGSTTLAVMTRASLGHSGLPLADSSTLTLIYVAINLAAVIRISASFLPDFYIALLGVSGVLWVAAFLVFAVKFAPVFFAKQ